MAPPNKPKTSKPKKTRKRIGPPVEEGPAEPLFEQHAGLGSENIKLDDVTWIGEDGQLEPYLMLEQLVREAALQDIVRAIIDRHPLEAEAGKPPLNPYTRENHALSALVGHKPKPGPPADDIGDVLDAAARSYYEHYFESMYEKELDAILREEMVRLGHMEEDLDPEARSNKLRKYRRAFNENKDALILRNTSHGRAALARKDELVSRVLQLLAELGLVRRKDG